MSWDADERRVRTTGGVRERKAIEVGEWGSPGKWAQCGLCHALGWCSEDPLAASPPRKAAAVKWGQIP